MWARGLSFLQLVSGLLHHEGVQTLQVSPTIVFITLFPCPEDDQCGVTSDLQGGCSKLYWYYYLYVYKYILVIIWSITQYLGYFRTLTEYLLHSERSTVQSTLAILTLVKPGKSFLERSSHVGARFLQWPHLDRRKLTHLMFCIYLCEDLMIFDVWLKVQLFLTSGKIEHSVYFFFLPWSKEFNEGDALGHRLLKVFLSQVQHFGLWAGEGVEICRV